jgi:chromosome segregation protein
MRLKRIKLAGFKSFVDPTTFELASNLVAIVGPNGCGKSNTIDAIRLVMGESSAKSLRGESISDVIFNGSTSRKPVGQAFVELVFDNTSGKIGGTYSQYAEIAVKRLVTRDGQSTFYLNGAKCRRKDVTDLFLGTGLGPRSYAIIEQGMISRLIEAKPEDLRVFLEEAAGISKYKERKRETELRMQHTRENLDRLNDLRQELAKQHKHLEKQAEAARLYTTYQEEERHLKAELAAVQAAEYLKEQNSLEEKTKNAQTSLDNYQVLLESLGLEHQALNDTYGSAQTEHDRVQKEVYRLSGEITRLEQMLKHYAEKEGETNYSLKQIAESLDKVATTVLEDSAKQTILEAEQAALLVEKEGAQKVLSEALSSLEDIEKQKQAHQSHYHSFLESSFEPTRLAEGSKAKVSSLEDQLRHAQERITRLETEAKSLDWRSLEAESQELEKELSLQKEAVQEISNKLEKNNELLSQSRKGLEEKRQNLQSNQASLQPLQREQAQLEGLQKAASGLQPKAFGEFLKTHSLEKAPRFLESVQVLSGWESAVELVLGSFLEAVAVESTAPYLNSVLNLEDGCRLSLFEPALELNSVSVAESGTLASKLETHTPFNVLLESIHVAQDLEGAYKILEQLPSNHSVILANGLWLGKGWIRFAKAKASDPAFGALEREKSLRALRKKISIQEEDIENLKKDIQVQKDLVQTLEREREDLQQTRSPLERKIATSLSEFSIKITKVEQLKRREQNLYKEIQENKAQQLQWQSQIAQGRMHLEKALEEMASIQEKRKLWEEEQATIDAIWQKAKTSKHSCEQEVNRKSLRLELIASEHKALANSLSRLAEHKAELFKKEESLKQSLEELKAPLIETKEQLSQIQAARGDLNKELASTKEILLDIQVKIKSQEAQRQQLFQEQEGVRRNLERSKLSLEGLSVRLELLEQQVQELGFELVALRATVAEDSTEAKCAAKIEKISNKIKKLGAINLAAIEEFTVCAERKQYLDLQDKDLSEALKTLEQAISTIDKETRTKFKETFELVNHHFSELFPRLFGGGKAYLELTGDELLDAGVMVMARPPGKRNSSIHQLSGGEKALTAVALVFGIFQLNPAPFCILDEVDAPLDEANVGRFCDLVREMSETVQFIFISHNKVTMEMADYLLGVTMREPGVSRLVSVSMNEAQAMVEA